MEARCSSKAADLELQSLGFDGVEPKQKNQLNETSGNISEGTVEPLQNEQLSKLDLPASALNKEGPVSEKNKVMEPGSSSAVHDKTWLEELEDLDFETSSESSSDDTSVDTESSDQELMQPSDSTDVGATPAQPATPFSPLIMEPTQSFPLALAEKMPQHGSSVNQSSPSKHESSSAQANRFNTRTESSLRAEPAPYVDKGKKIMVADDLGKNKGKYHPSLHHPSFFPRAPTGIRILDRESTQTNQQQPPSLLSNKENEIPRPLASGPQVNQFKGLNISDPLCYNFILPVPPKSSRNQQWNSPMHMLSQVASMANAADSLLQKPEQAKHPLPVEHMPRQYSPSPLGPSNSQTPSTMVHQSSLPLSNPSLPNQQQPNSELPQTPVMPRLQTEKQQGPLNQTTRPNPIYPTAGTSFPSLFLPETMGSSAPYHMESLLSSQKEQGAAGLLGHARSRIEAGESSPFKRFRREPTIPDASSAEQVNKNPLALLTEATSASDIANFIRNPRPLKNSLYDPKYEELGLPIDPHLRFFLQSKK